MPAFYRTAPVIFQLIVVACCPGLAAAAEPAGAPQDRVIAVVNGTPLSRSDFFAFAGTRIGPGHNVSELSKEQINALLAEYVNRELIYQDAVAQGVDKQPDVRLAINNQQRNIIASYRIRQLIARPPSDEAMKDAYQKNKARPTKEYLARHILVKTENEAEDVIQALDAGTDFAKLAQERSIDASGKEGGSVGWLTAGQMVQPLRGAVTALSPGQYTKTPVQTQFGWHVVQLDNTRIIPPPDFESVKDRLRRELQSQMVSRYVNQLRQKGSVEIK